ncbi:hypothetical protein PCHDS_000092700 [Plasmodium chabaudi adami]|uniref:Uncharacterized protein n=1 Tax=Plasmodium chabaudi adami TaxID=5826 RepID=A0A1C6Y7U9_PLACE|nr:hypothetical protein PCHDS_000092700 [Plasmodium chabaudi adami]
MLRKKNKTVSKLLQSVDPISFESPQQILPSEPPPPTTTIQKGSFDSQGVSNAAVGQLSNQGDTSKGLDSGQHNTANEIGKQGNDIIDKPEQS